MGPDSKSSVFPRESWIVATSLLPEKHRGSFFSSLQQQLFQVFEFSETAYVPFLAGKSSNSTAAAAAASLQSCPTLCDPIDGSPPGSPVPGILQARTLEWGAISFSSA